MPIFAKSRSCKAMSNQEVDASNEKYACIKRMLRCSVIAMLLNPVSWLSLFNPLMIVTSFQIFLVCLCYVGLYVLPYLILGSAERYWLRRKPWPLQAFVIWISVNAVILSVIFLFSYDAMTSNGVRCLSPLVIIIPVSSVIGSLLSAIPIAYYCKH
jgi:drug/metabolite transporter (DMT)-like permease